MNRDYIDYIDYLIDIAQRNDVFYLTSSEFSEFSAEVLEALERQMPRKLKLIDELGIFGLCQCGEAVQPPEVYCWACGQLIDWSEE